MDSTLGALVRGVDLLCLDAGNTVVFLDHARLAAAFGRTGFDATPDALNEAEGATKIAIDRGDLADVAWQVAGIASARAWGRYIGSIARTAGLPAAKVPALLDALWAEHRRRNFWDLVPAGLGAALDAARIAGARVAIVSNSEGHLDGLLVDVALRASIDLVVDSGIVGVEKPDPRIFRFALDSFGIPAERALHLGDIYGTDVLGARAAGIRCALVDPHGHLAGHHPDVPRVASAADVARALAAHRTAMTSD
jgi:FMN phosphatase YigB (HAD superfamily)